MIAASKIFIAALKQLEENKSANIQKMTELSFEKLAKLKARYFQYATDAEAAGFSESAAVNKEKWVQIIEAIEMKKGNEEQVWDYLT
ncbi:MAG: hypothetical protein ABL872_13190 [Lacibacter sp.]